MFIHRSLPNTIRPYLRTFRHGIHTGPLTPRFTPRHSTNLIVCGLGLAVGTVWTMNRMSSPVVCDDGKTDLKESKFKKDRMGHYENRLRKFSHPLKVFNYFASVTKHGERYMTSHDFIRSLVPYREYLDDIPEERKRVPSAEAFFALADTNGDGLISFSEYMIFLGLLGTPEYHWKISFKLFDFNGDGTVSKDEFEKIMAHHTTGYGFGARLGTRERSQVDVAHSGIYQLFFGAKGEKTLVYDEFIDFMRRLHLEVLKLEFYQYNVDPVTSTIGLSDFAIATMTYAAPKQIKRLLTRVRELPEYEERITFQQFFEFDQMIRTRLHDLGLAYKLYSSMSRGLDREDFRRVVRAVTKTNLTVGQTDVIFQLYDVNGDGYLNVDEFYNTVMKGRHARGLDTSRDLGLLEYFKTVARCVRETYDEDVAVTR